MQAYLFSLLDVSLEYFINHVILPSDIFVYNNMILRQLLYHTERVYLYMNTQFVVLVCRASQFWPNILCLYINMTIIVI